MYAVFREIYSRTAALGMACLLLLLGPPAWAGKGHESAADTLPDIELTLVYPQEPDSGAAYARVVSEVTDLVHEGDFRRLRIDAHVVTGKEYMERSWHRIKDDSGRDITVNYDPGTHKISHDGKLLKQL